MVKMMDIQHEIKNNCVDRQGYWYATELFDGGRGKLIENSGKVFLFDFDDRTRCTDATFTSQEERDERE